MDVVVGANGCTRARDADAVDVEDVVDAAEEGPLRTTRRVSFVVPCVSEEGADDTFSSATAPPPEGGPSGDACRRTT